MRLLTCLSLLAALLVVSAPTPDAQAARTGPAPALDFGTLLDTYFLPARSEIRLGDPRDYFLLFPADGFDAYDVGGRYQLLDETGAVVWQADLRYGGETITPAIATLKGSGATAQIPASGVYTLEVVVGGLTIGALPFVAEVQDSGDPFSPVPTTRVDGPWRTHAYFDHAEGEPGDPLIFNAWLRRDEPQGQQTSEVSIRRDGQEVAWGAGSADGSNDGWVRAEYRLYTPDARADGFGRHTNNAQNWIIEDVTPGDYEVVLSTEDGAFRTMSIVGGDGAFVPHMRSALETEPRTHYLTPRRLAGQMLNRAHRLDWLGPETL